MRAPDTDTNNSRNIKKRTRNEQIAVAVGLVVVTATIIVPSFAFGIIETLFRAGGEESLRSDNVSELIVRDIVPGNGAEVRSGDTLTIHYVGSLSDGTIFDRSTDDSVPFSFTQGSGKVIPGLDQGVLGMKEGGIRLLIIPPELGYGELSYGPVPADSVLLFEIELLSVEGELPD